MASNDESDTIEDQLESIWQKWGQLDKHVWAPMISDMVIGLPPWPSYRKAYRTAHHGPFQLVATDGLTDKFDPDHPYLDPDYDDYDDLLKSHGFGCELFALGEVQGEPVVPGHWMFELVAQVATQLAHYGPWFAGRLHPSDPEDIEGVMSMDITATGSLAQLSQKDFVHKSPIASPDCMYVTVLVMSRHQNVHNIPEHIIVEDDRQVGICCVQLLTNDESKEIYQNGHSGRGKIIKALKEQNTLGISSLNRQSVG